MYQISCGKMEIGLRRRHVTGCKGRAKEAGVRNACIYLLYEHIFGAFATESVTTMPLTKDFMCYSLSVLQ